MALTHTFTRVHNETRFADPYKLCLQCGSWVDGFLDVGEGPHLITPCEHASDYRDVCPSWGPVDGCTCAEVGIVHEMRPRPTVSDDKVY